LFSIGCPALPRYHHGAAWQGAIARAMLAYDQRDQRYNQ
jgi:hypothetical protein